MHSHPNTVAVFLTDAKGTFAFPDGKKQDFAVKAGDAQYSAASTHLPENTGDKDMEVIVTPVERQDGEGSYSGESRASQGDEEVNPASTYHGSFGRPTIYVGRCHLRVGHLQWHNKWWLSSRLAQARFCVETRREVIKRSSKTAGFNNPAGRACSCAVDLLEPVDAFNISVPGPKAAGLKADLKCRLRLLLWKSEASVARSIITLYSPITPWMRALPRPDASLGLAR